MRENRRKRYKSVEMVCKKEVEWLVLKTVVVNRTHSIQINNHKMRKALKELHAVIRRESLYTAAKTIVRHREM